MTEPILVLTGPTAAGKTALALPLAEQLGLEILSMDSMAVYRRLDIGTAKPSAAERARVPHWLIDLVEPQEGFDTQRWCSAAEQALAAVRARGKRALLVGGTPLYLMSLCKGLMVAPPAQPELRARLEAREQEAPGSLHKELLLVDPAAAARIHPRDRKRLVRALEVLAVTGRPISAQQREWEAPGWQRPCRIVAVRLPREELHERVRQRTRAMLERGLVEETRAIRDSCGFGRQAAAAIGYAECLDWLRGRYKDEEELRNRIRRATHRLIRRQLTWLRPLTDIRWVDAGVSLAALRAAFEAA